MKAFFRLLNDQPDEGRSKSWGLILILATANLAAWVWALKVFSGQPALLGTALLAYLFGLRHALDADHIAAIDNVVRKLSQKGAKPISTGFFFSLGHSSVVVLASLGVGELAQGGQSWLKRAGEWGGVCGTAVSAFFLLFIAFSNLLILKALWIVFIKARQGTSVNEEDLNILLSGRGFLTRLMKRLFELVDQSWKMYPVGFLFGLGFDTSTEVALLGLSASQATKGLSLITVMVFPALFTVGMSLVDTADSLLMVEAYGWAFLKPLRKLWYNLTLTALSIWIALLVGGVEALGLLADHLKLSGGFWKKLLGLNGNLGELGISIVAMFFLVWMVSLFLYRFLQLDEKPSLKGERT